MSSAGQHDALLLPSPVQQANVSALVVLWLEEIPSDLRRRRRLRRVRDVIVFGVLVLFAVTEAFASLAGMMFEYSL